MNRSEQINELADALSKAQASYGTVKRSGRNPQFRSEYSTFDDVMNAVRKPLADNGLAFSQMLDNLDGAAALTSMLMHKSGQFTSATVPIITVESRLSSSGKKANNEVQMFGISSSYTKRYAATAMLGIGGEEDNDGNAGDDPAPTAHWIENETVRKRFWVKYTKEGLSRDDIHKALGVSSVKQFEGSMDDAKTRINEWIDKAAF